MENTMKKGKQWLILFFAVVAVGTAAFMMVNYMIDPTGYFSVERKAGEVDANGYTRAAKVNISRSIKMNIMQSCSADRSPVS